MSHFGREGRDGRFHGSYTDSSGNLKPGIDFYSSGSRQGQALMLQNFAASHKVRMVAVSIGGNDFNFASIVQSCVTDFLTSPSWLPNYCDDDSSVTANFTSAHVAAVRSAVAQALRNCLRQAYNGGVPRGGTCTRNGTGTNGNGEPAMSLS